MKLSYTLAASLLLACTSAVGVEPYDITVVGLTDAEHTRDDGYRYSSNYHTPALSFNEAGQVIGYSERYNGGASSLGRSAWLYNNGSTINIGLTGAEYTLFNGTRDSASQFLNEAGQVAGWSKRQNSGGGLSAWLYAGGSSTNIGLTDTEHTRIDGYLASSIEYLNEAGQVAGYADRFNGGSALLGRSAWLHSGGNTIKIGLTGTEHTRADGYQYNAPLQTPSYTLNNAGQVVGKASLYNGGSTQLGTSVWLHSNGTTVNIGLTDFEHTQANGGQVSGTQSFDSMNEAGQVVGFSSRHNGGSTSLGSSAWLHSEGSTINIGLIGADYTRADGYRLSSVESINEAGNVTGFSNRYGGSTNLGKRVWLHSGGSTAAIGLTNSEHTRSDNYQFNAAELLNEAGEVAGTAHRYNGATQAGQSAWLHSGGNTVDISLKDTEHLSNDGLHYTTTESLNEDGQVVGYVNRYNGGSQPLGRDIFMYSDGTTSNISPADSEHTRSDGYRYSFLTSLNDSGQVFGSARRYNDRPFSEFENPSAYDLGLSAFFFDSLTDQSYSLDFSFRPDGYSYSSSRYLGDDGLMLGYYRLYDGYTLLGNRAFSFTLEDGMQDLGSLIDIGLEEAGWLSLASAVRANEAGQIFGYGLTDDMTSGQMGYLLTPSSTTVPLPQAFWLFTAGMVVLIRVARNEKASN